MNRTEFLTILRNQLAGQMQEGKAEAHIRYYEDYIQSQVRKGRTEEDVLGELGDPRLIAKTLIETEDSQPQAGYGQYSSYGSGVEESVQPEKRWKKILIDGFYLHVICMRAGLQRQQNKNIAKKIFRNLFIVTCSL